MQLSRRYSSTKRVTHMNWNGYWQKSDTREKISVLIHSSRVSAKADSDFFSVSYCESFFDARRMFEIKRRAKQERTRECERWFGQEKCVVTVNPLTVLLWLFFFRFTVLSNIRVVFEDDERSFFFFLSKIIHRGGSSTNRMLRHRRRERKENLSDSLTKHINRGVRLPRASPLSGEEIRRERDRERETEITFFIISLQANRNYSFVLIRRRNVWLFKRAALPLVDRWHLLSERRWTRLSSRYFAGIRSILFTVFFSQNVSMPVEPLKRTLTRNFLVADVQTDSSN